MTLKDWLLLLCVGAVVALATALVLGWWRRRTDVRQSQQEARGEVEKRTQDHLAEEQRLSAEEAREKLRRKYGEEGGDR